VAKLTEMPGAAIIGGFKGKIDFYYYMGIPVARSWPRSPGHDRSPQVEAQWPKFTYVAKLWATLAPEIKDAWNRMATGVPLTGRDIFHKSYYKPQYVWSP